MRPTARKQAMQSQLPGVISELCRADEIHAQLRCHGGSTSPKAMRKYRRRRSSRLMQRRLGLTTEPVRALANALRTTRSTFIVSAIL